MAFCTSAQSPMEKDFLNKHLFKIILKCPSTEMMYPIVLTIINLRYPGKSSHQQLIKSVAV